MTRWSVVRAVIAVVVVLASCKPEAGPAGADGSSVTATTEPPGANCANGGVKLTSSSGDSYVCSGSGPSGTLELAAGSATATSLGFTGQTGTGVFSPAAGALGFATSGVLRLTIDPGGNFILGGEQDHLLGLGPNPNNGPGHALTLAGGPASTGAIDQPGGELVLAAGPGTGQGGSGDIHVMTAGATVASGSTPDTLIDREIVVGKAKVMTLSAPGFTSLMSIRLTGTNVAGGRIHYTIRATDGGSQIVVETGVIQYAAMANQITCTVQTTDKLHLGTVGSACTPGFFNPLSQPGISLSDNVAFSSPAPLVVHEVFFEIENQSGSAIRLEP